MDKGKCCSVCIVSGLQCFVSKSFVLSNLTFHSVCHFEILSNTIKATFQNPDSLHYVTDESTVIVDFFLKDRCLHSI